jgi:hypothetical protein
MEPLTRSVPLMVRGGVNVEIVVTHACRSGLVQRLRTRTRARIHTDTHTHTRTHTRTPQTAPGNHETDDPSLLPSPEHMADGPSLYHGNDAGGECNVPYEVRVLCCGVQVCA